MIIDLLYLLVSGFMNAHQFFFIIPAMIGAFMFVSGIAPGFAGGNISMEIAGSGAVLLAIGFAGLAGVKS